MEKQQSRELNSLIYNLGSVVMDALQDPSVIEVMLNPDSSLWLDTLDKGMVEVGTIPVNKATSIINVMASILGTVVDKHNPIIEGELPLDGSRFTGIIPPVASRPVITIRKRPCRVFTLEEYVSSGIISPLAKDCMEKAIIAHKNVIISGAPKSGKTTFSNGYLGKIAELCPDERLVVFEDTYELQCISKNKVPLHTTEHTEMDSLLRVTLRLSPGRIIVGEVRSGEALPLIHAWNTGTRGGLCTVHADSAYDSLIRLEQLIKTVSPSCPRALVQRAVDLVIFIECPEEGKRRVTQVAEVNGLCENDYQLNYIINERRN